MTTTAIRHGYTLADLDRLARTAAVTAHGGALDPLTRYQLAWSAIAEHLAAASDHPTRADLLAAGRAEIHADLAAALHARGYQSVAAGPGSMPRWCAYWHHPDSDRAEDRVTDSIAIGQTLTLLTRRQRQAVTALAVLGDYPEAAAALGLSYARCAALIAEARRAVWAAWYAPDAPPSYRGHDKRRGSHLPRTHCPSGHALDGDNLRLRRRTRGRVERVCRACESERARTRWAARAEAA